MVIRRTLACALFFALPACSHAAHPPPADLSVSEGGPPNPQPMGAVTGTPVADAGGDGASVDGAVLACNALTFDSAAVIPRTAVPDVFPLPMGGELIAGTYAATKYEIYTGSGGAVQTSGSFQGVLVLAAGTAQIYSLLNTALVERRTAAYSTTMTTLTLKDSCPDKKVSADGYSVINGNAIAIFSTLTKEVITFTKQ